MKMIKILSPLSTILAIICIVIAIVKYTNLVPSYTDSLENLGDIGFATFAFCAVLLSYQWEHLYKTRNREYDSATITMDKQESIIKHRDNEVKELNGMIQDAQQTISTYKQKLQKSDDNISNYIELLLQIEKDGKPVAITSDNSLYFSFEVKKESGLIVTRKEKGKPEKIAKNEKVPAKLGIDIGGITHVFEDGTIKIFDPLNALTKTNVSNVVRGVFKDKES